jgi:hypothetical protein
MYSFNSLKSIQNFNKYGNFNVDYLENDKQHKNIALFNKKNLDGEIDSIRNSLKFKNEFIKTLENSSTTREIKNSKTSLKLKTAHSPNKWKNFIFTEFSQNQQNTLSTNMDARLSNINYENQNTQTNLNIYNQTLTSESKHLVTNPTIPTIPCLNTPHHQALKNAIFEEDIGSKTCSEMRLKNKILHAETQRPRIKSLVFKKLHDSITVQHSKNNSELLNQDDVFKSYLLSSASHTKKRQSNNLRQQTMTFTSKTKTQLNDANQSIEEEKNLHRRQPSDINEILWNSNNNLLKINHQHDEMNKEIRKEKARNKKRETELIYKKVFDKKYAKLINSSIRSDGKRISQKTTPQSPINQPGKNTANFLNKPPQTYVKDKIKDIKSKIFFIKGVFDYAYPLVMIEKIRSQKKYYEKYIEQFNKNILAKNESLKMLHQQQGRIPFEEVIQTRANDKKIALKRGELSNTNTLQKSGQKFYSPTPRKKSS